jgi:hypothetical protein
LIKNGSGVNVQAMIGKILDSRQLNPKLFAPLKRRALSTMKTGTK